MHDEDKMKRLTAFAADLLTRIQALTAERDEAVLGNHSLNEHEPTWAELTTFWKARAEKAEADAARLRAAFRVNMLRLIPGVTHADIDAAISAALTGKEPT